MRCAQVQVSGASKGKRRVSGWQAELGSSPSIRASPSMRATDGYASDEDFGVLAMREFFPTTSSTGFSADGGPISGNPGAAGRSDSAAAHMHQPSAGLSRASRTSRASRASRESRHGAL
jgi:hypothetical protein